jgi:hypothetical protein
VSSLVPPALLRGLVDDAAVFPPGLAAIPDAVRDHRAHRSAWYAPFIGPLLVPEPSLDAFAQCAVSPLRITLVGDRTRPDALQRLLDAAARARDGGCGEEVHLAAVETALPAGAGRPDQAEQARRIGDELDRSLPAGVLAWVEVHRGPDLPDALSALAGAPARIGAKFRTGGTEAAAFPSPVELADVLHAARRVGVPLKLTAGLHHAVRHTDPRTGFPHHGFVNVLAALAAANAGASVAEMTDVLSCGDPAFLSERLTSLDDDTARAVRSTFVSFGCCGVTEPVDDLVSLGLVEPGVPYADQQKELA